MHKPFFSIIIPTLNEEYFLPLLLQSLLKQTETFFEVIVVDGGSSDATVAKVEQFQPKFAARNIPLSLIVSPKKNVSFQRNLGAEKAAGSYYVFFDADVSMKPDYLERIHEIILRDKAEFLTTWTETTSTDPQDKAMILVTNLTMETAQFVHFDFVPGFNVIVKKTAFDKVGGFDVHVIHAEDHHFSQKLKVAGYNLVLLKEPKVVCSLRRYHREGTLNVLRKYTQSTLHIFLKGPITKEIFKYEMGGHLYKHGDKKKSTLLRLSTLKKWRQQILKQINELEEFLHNI